jgi:hypothetical protein
VLDSILCERRGLPAVAIVTDAFVETGQLMAAKWGAPDFKFLAVPHPVANLSGAELDRCADGVIDDVVKLLKEGQPS